jgi:hypothetical protein
VVQPWIRKFTKQTAFEQIERGGTLILIIVVTHGFLCSIFLDKADRIFIRMKEEKEKREDG